MRKYEQLKHMIKVDRDSPFKEYYLPYHAVSKANNLTMKIRLVFDASPKRNSGISLNVHGWYHDPISLR